MPVTGKQCTITIDTTDHSAEAITLNSTKNRETKTEHAWGASYVTDGEETFEATFTMFFNPGASTAAAVLEAAWDAKTTHDFVVDINGTVRTFSDWKVASYADTIEPNDSIKAEVKLVGNSPFATDHTP